MDCKLIRAAIAGYYDEVKLLLDQGANIQHEDKYGYTALTCASRLGHTDVVRLLLDRGANVNQRNNFGNTALMWASCRGHINVIRLLLDRGANIEHKNCRNKTALTWASRNGRTNVIKLLNDYPIILKQTHSNLIKLINQSLPYGRIDLNIFRDVSQLVYKKSNLLQYKIT